MVKLWSELPGARAREMVADVATLGWVVLWLAIGWTVYAFISGFAEAGRLVRGGGESLQSAGDRVGDQLMGLPLVGEPVSDAIRQGFDGAGSPIVSAGREIESLVIAIATTLAIVLVLVPLIPWLTRYLPWRVDRVRRTRAAHRAIRRAPSGASVARVERVLAGRALNRLDWVTLLEYTPDPIGDWEAGRFSGLARAEYESAGLRPDAVPVRPPHPAL
ncbi:MAG TPA: hypothetical protein VM344_09440 [Vitreimonas sp.]|nr:hypothetical protein [Vitreimonas sp.]